MGTHTFENCVSSASAGAMPRFSHILPVRGGQDEPEKTRVFLIVSEGEGEEEKIEVGVKV